MKTAQRAWRCLARNPGKTLLLALVLFAASTLYLGTTVILDAATQAQETLAAKTQAKIICEATDAAQPLAAADVDRVAACAGVARVKRQLQATVTLETGTPVTRSDSTARANSQLSLIGLDDLAGDGPFADGSYRLQKGQRDVGKDGVIVNAVLAAQNDWQIGDAITIEAAGKTLQLSICGIFSAGNEEKQSANTLALGRTENQLYASAEQVATLGDAATLVRLYAVSDEPWRLDTLADELQQLFGARAEITTAAALYEQTAAPLAQLSLVVTLLRTVAVVAAAFVTALLLTMWLRTRRREMAILLSLGAKKRTLFAQVLLEVEVVFAASACTALAVVWLLAQMWRASLAQQFGSALSLQLHFGTITGFILAGGALLAVCMALAMLSILRKHPRSLLSEMEE